MKHLTIKYLTKVKTYKVTVKSDLSNLAASPSTAKYCYTLTAKHLPTVKYNANVFIYLSIFMQSHFNELPFVIFKFAHVRITQYAPLKLKRDKIKKQLLVCVSVFTLLSKDLCPTVNWTNGLGTLLTFLPDWRIYKCLLISLPHSNTYIKLI